MNNKFEHGDIPEILEHIDCATCSYEEWLQVGMALKENDFPLSLWEDWSRTDMARYNDRECAYKWNSFTGSPRPIGTGTIVQIAKEHGYDPNTPENRGYELDWDSVISRDEPQVVNGVAEEQVPSVGRFDGRQQLITYLETLFKPEEYVGYSRDTFTNSKGKVQPTRGNFDRTAGQLLDLLRKTEDIGEVIGDTLPEVGAWIRFNPLDGKGASDVNVTAYRYALVENDTMSIEAQYAILKALQLPIALLVHSGGKSLHAIVRIDAKSLTEYYQKVNYLYEVCRKNGLEPDKNNINPSRLSRMPGVMRNGNPQYIVEKGMGYESYEDWRDFVEETADNLPEETRYDTVRNNLPPLAEELIEGVLRRGHKLMLSGPSKAGKSFAMIELSIAIAEGRPWFGFPCRMGKVMYVNMELDEASCLHRFDDVYRSMGIDSPHAENLYIWNLRGHVTTMDELAPKIIRRCKAKKLDAIIIDPIYKVMVGDENSAGDMARFCNEFDRVATSLGCSVIYAHHHSKGSQLSKKVMDRASGSGVFARDPDAIIDMTELEIKDELLAARNAEVHCEEIRRYILEHYPEIAYELITPENEHNSVAMMSVLGKLPEAEQKLVCGLIHDEELRLAETTEWIIEGTLREFKTFHPLRVRFEYPVHHIVGGLDIDEIKAGIRAKRAEERKAKKEAQRMLAEERKKEEREENAARKKAEHDAAAAKKQAEKEEEHRRILENLNSAFEGLVAGHDFQCVRIGEISERLSVCRNTVKKWIDLPGSGLKRNDEGWVVRSNSQES